MQALSVSLVLGNIMGQCGGSMPGGPEMLERHWCSSLANLDPPDCSRCRFSCGLLSVTMVTVDGWFHKSPAVGPGSFDCPLMSLRAQRGNRVAASTNSVASSTLTATFRYSNGPAVAPGSCDYPCDQIYPLTLSLSKGARTRLDRFAVNLQPWCLEPWCLEPWCLPTILLPAQAGATVIASQGAAEV